MFEVLIGAFYTRCRLT